MTQRTLVHRLCCGAVAWALLAPGADAQAASKFDSHLQQSLKRGSGKERVIVRVKPGQRAAVAHKLRRAGHSVYGDHSGIDAISVHMSVAALRALANDPAVESVSTDADLDALDSKKGSSSTSSTTMSAVSSLLTTLGMTNYNLGSTIGIAVLDSGLQNVEPAIDPRNGNDVARRVGQRARGNSIELAHRAAGAFGKRRDPS
jgi:hypothetical protein